MKTSLIITGDGKVAKAEVDALRASVEQLGGSAKGTAPAAQQLDKALDGVQQSAKGAASGVSDVAQALPRVRKGVEQAADAGEKLNKVNGLQRAGYQQLGFQLQDVGIQYASGTRAATIFAMQSGQMAGAIGMIAQGSENAKGALGRFAGVMAGPWGIAAGVAISLGAALWSELSKVDDASEDASKSTIDFSSSLVASQGIINNYTDALSQAEQATRGLINTQALLIDNSRLFAQANVQRMQGELAAIDKQIADRSKGANSFWANMPGFFGSGPEDKGALTKLQAARGELQDELRRAQAVQATTQTAYESRMAQESADADLRARNEIARARARLEERRQYTLGLQGNVPLAGGEGWLEQISGADFSREMAELTRRENALKEREKKPKKDNSAAKAAREAERLAQFGERAEDAIARLNDQFNAAPRDIDKARQATDQLDGIIADLEKRKPANFKELIAQAQAIKPLIQESLARPIRDMITDQERQIALGALQVSGRQAEADALNLTYSLMDKLGVESEAQLATELAKRGIREDEVRHLYGSLDIMRQQTREMAAQEKLLQGWLSAVGDMRENVRLTLQDLRQDGPKALGDFAKRGLDVFDRLFSDIATEKLFGGLLRDLSDQVTGANKVSKAGDKMADAVGKAATEITKMGSAAAQATAVMTGKAAPASASAGLGAIAGEAVDADITVTANPLKVLKSGFKEGFEEVFGDLKTGFKDLFTDIFGDKGIFSESLGKALGQTFGNAALGGAAGSLATGLLGMKGSGTGGMLGGALGGALGKELLGGLGSFAGPLGSMIGGTLGSIVGGMLKKTRYGTAVVTGGGEGDVSVAGNSNSRKQASIGLASSIQDTLGQIAEEFDAQVGSFNTSIGVYKKKYRVSTTGYQGKLNFSGASANGLHNFDDDQAGAIAFATLDAIRDGGIKGMSDAIRKAFNSSDDLDKALKEALKVREVETLLGGLGAVLEDEFRTFERQAKERVRIASQYGFDVVAIEKKNAEDRAKLVDQILSDRIGSLQSLLDNMKHGDLFEGSLADQRQALLAQVAQARTAAEAGDDGAADRLANLSRQLVELSRDAFGTAGAEYASDRDSVIGTAEAVIKAENERIKAAQDAATKQTEATQAVADNTAAANDKLDAMVRALKDLGVNWGSGNIGANLNTSLVAR